jgi:hypothetical protein
MTPGVMENLSTTALTVLPFNMKKCELLFSTITHCMRIATIHASCDTACIQSRTNICLGKLSGAKLIFTGIKIVSV